MAEYFHIRHSCGHAVFWNDATFAVLARLFPCPWCGGETGVKAPDDTHVFIDGRPHGAWAPQPVSPNALVCVRRQNADGSLDTPDDGSNDFTVIIRHAADESCCSETRPTGWKGERPPGWAIRINPEDTGRRN